MSIKKLITGIWYAVTSEKNKLVPSILCGFPLITFRETIRNKADQDDSWFYYLAKHHNAIFDIGANIGYTALLAMIQNPHRLYVLVDPNPKALAIAYQNLMHNNLGFRAHYFLGFVSDKLDELVKFYTLGAGAAGSMYASHAESAAAVNSFTEVQTVTLDYLYAFYNLKPDLVKIDVEGAETLVMEGAYTLAKETQCTFFIEMHSLKHLGMEQAGQFMIDWCDKMNYKAWYLKTGEELLHAETIKNRGKCHLLLLPNSAAYPEYLINVKQNAPLPKSLD